MPEDGLRERFIVENTKYYFKTFRRLPSAGRLSPVPRRVRGRLAHVWKPSYYFGLADVVVPSAHPQHRRQHGTTEHARLRLL